MKEFDQQAIEDICNFAFDNYGVKVTEVTLTKIQLSNYNKKLFKKYKIILADEEPPQTLKFSPAFAGAVQLKVQE